MRIGESERSREREKMRQTVRMSEIECVSCDGVGIDQTFPPMTLSFHKNMEREKNGDL